MGQCAEQMNLRQIGVVLSVDVGKVEAGGFGIGAER